MANQDQCNHARLWKSPWQRHVYCKRPRHVCVNRFSIHNILYIIFSEDKELVPKDQHGTSSVTVAYISFGVVFILLVVCFVVAFWCYRKYSRKRLERLPLIAAFCHSMSQPRARLKLKSPVKLEPTSLLKFF